MCPERPIDIGDLGELWESVNLKFSSQTYFLASFTRFFEELCSSLTSSIRAKAAVESCCCSRNISDRNDGTRSSRFLSCDSTSAHPPAAATMAMPVYRGWW